MRYAQSSACSSGRNSAYSPNRISQHRTVVQAIMVVVTVRPRRKPNTTSNAFGVERSDSLTLVTSWIASATHQTGQWPPTGHAAVDLMAGTGTGTCSQRWVTGAHGETASPKNCGSLTGSPSIAHARSTDVEWTGPRAVDTLSGAVSQSVHYPFFSAPSRAANRARNSADSTSRRSDCSRSCCSWDSSLARAARSSWALASCANARSRQVLRDRSTAAAWFRHLLHSARSSRYFSRSLLRLFNKDRTRIRRGDFA